MTMTLFRVACVLLVCSAVVSSQMTQHNPNPFQDASRFAEEGVDVDVDLDEEVGVTACPHAALTAANVGCSDPLSIQKSPHQGRGFKTRTVIVCPHELITCNGRNLANRFPIVCSHLDDPETQLWNAYTTAIGRGTTDQIKLKMGDSVRYWKPAGNTNQQKAMYINFLKYLVKAACPARFVAVDLLYSFKYMAGADEAWGAAENKAEWMATKANDFIANQETTTRFPTECTQNQFRAVYGNPAQGPDHNSIPDTVKALMVAFDAEDNFGRLVASIAQLGVGNKAYAAWSKDMPTGFETSSAGEYIMDIAETILTELAADRAGANFAAVAAAARGAPDGRGRKRRLFTSLVVNPSAGIKAIYKRFDAHEHYIKEADTHAVKACEAQNCHEKANEQTCTGATAAGRSCCVWSDTWNKCLTKGGCPKATAPLDLSGKNSIQLLVVGDQGKGGAHQKRVAWAMYHTCIKEGKRILDDNDYEVPAYGSDLATRSTQNRANDAQYLKAGCHLALTNGDNIYPDGAFTFDELTTNFESFYEAFGEMPFVFTLGNHDYGTKGESDKKGGHRGWEKAAKLQVEYGKKCNKRAYMKDRFYRLTSTDKRVKIPTWMDLNVLDTNFGDHGSRVQEWKADMQTQKQMVCGGENRDGVRFRLASSHHPAFTGNSHGTSTGQGEAWVAAGYLGFRKAMSDGTFTDLYSELARDCDVNMISQGHDHHMQHNQVYVPAGAGSTGHAAHEFDALLVGNSGKPPHHNSWKSSTGAWYHRTIGSTNTGSEADAADAAKLRWRYMKGSVQGSGSNFGATSSLRKNGFALLTIANTGAYTVKMFSVGVPDGNNDPDPDELKLHYQCTKPADGTHCVCENADNTVGGCPAQPDLGGGRFARKWTRDRVREHLRGVRGGQTV